MPYHHIPTSRIHEDTRDLERQGERIVSAQLDGEHFHVFTEFVHTHIELRGLTHQARTGVDA